MIKKIGGVLFLLYAIAQYISFFKYQSVPQLFWAVIATVICVYLFKGKKA